MTSTGTGVAVKFEPRTLLSKLDGRYLYAHYPKPGLSRQAFISLLMCVPVTCMLWAAIIYGAVRLAR